MNVEQCPCADTKSRRCDGSVVGLCRNGFWYILCPLSLGALSRETNSFAQGATGAGEFGADLDPSGTEHDCGSS